MAFNTLGAIKFLFKIRQNRFPFKLNFAVTYKCNFRCKTCNIWKIYHKKPELEKEELTLNEIDTFFEKSNYFNWINFTGGEPFLRKDLTDIVVSAFESCKDLIIVNIPTNGYLTKEIINSAKKILETTKIPFFIISISLDGPEELHDKIKNQRGAWKNAMNTYKKLSKFKKDYKNFQLILEYTLSKLNENSLIKTVKTLRGFDIKPSNIHLNFFNTSEIFYQNQNQNFFVDFNSIKEIEIFRNSRLNIDVLTVFSNIFLKLAIKYLKTGKNPLKTCAAGRYSIFMDPYGNVFPCIPFGKKFGCIKHVEYNLNKLINSYTAEEIRKIIESRKCPGCWTPCEAYQTMIKTWETIKNVVRLW